MLSIELKASRPALRLDKNLFGLVDSFTDRVQDSQMAFSSKPEFDSIEDTIAAFSEIHHCPPAKPCTKHVLL